MMRDVRDVMVISLCFCLRDVMRGVARDVRDVALQVIDFIAGGEKQSAAPCALVTTLLDGRRLLARRARLLLGSPVRHSQEPHP
jgi:hypothetical protein